MHQRSGAWPLRWVAVTTILGIIGLAGVAWAPPAAAAVTITVEPLTWDILGLDSNKPTSDGPDTFPVGARACNTGDTAASDVVASFVWDTANSFIDLGGPSALSAPTLAAGTCFDFYFNVVVDRDAAAFTTARGYHIEVDTAETTPVSTPTPREFYIEQLVSQNRNSITAITGPGGIGDPAPTTVVVGQTYTYKLFADTATNGYEQLEAFINLPNVIFRVLSVDATYSAPPGATNDRPYADACGWDPDPTSGTYQSCIGPENFTGGKAGGTTVTTYVVEIISTGTATVSGLIYDFSGSSFHYNSDFGIPTKSVEITAVDPDADLVVAKTDTSDPVTVGDPVTYTVTVTNNGPVDATGVTVTDTLDAATSYVSATPDQGSCSETGGTITCDLGAIAAGNSATITIVADTATIGTVTNTVAVTGDQPDPDPDNNTTTETTTIASVVKLADLRVTKTGPVDAAVGETVTYTIVVDNLGPSTAVDTSLTDDLPAGVVYESARTTHGTCNATGNRVTCGLGDLPAGDTATVVITTVVADDPPTTISNSAAVTSSVADPNAGNNVSSTDLAISSSSGALPATGSDLGAITRTGLAVLLWGGLFVIVTRRKHIGAGQG